MVHKDHVPEAHDEVLSSRWYREVDPETYRSEIVTKRYKTLCAHVERVIDEGEVLPGTCFGRSFVLVPPRLPLWISLSNLMKELGFGDVPQHPQLGFFKVWRGCPSGPLASFVGG